MTGEALPARFLCFLSPAYDLPAYRVKAECKRLRSSESKVHMLNLERIFYSKKYFGGIHFARVHFYF